MRGYVIFLSTKSFSYPYEDYGYWTGKSYTHQGSHYPSCESEVTKDTKIYKRKTSAENMGKKLFEKYGDVSDWRVEEVDSITITLF